MPFYGWIHDLSERDPTSLFNLFGLLPYDVPSFLMISCDLFVGSRHFQKSQVICRIPRSGPAFRVGAVCARVRT